MGCITDARFDMKADVIRQQVDGDGNGHWEYQQDPDSGAIIRVWVPDSDPEEPGVQPETFICSAKGIISSGIQATGTTQKFDEIYENIDWVKMTFPKEVALRKNDRVTNIRYGRTGEIIWKEEEIEDSPPTVFVVKGVTPVTAPFVGYVENFALLERAEVQS